MVENLNYPRCMRMLAEKQSSNTTLLVSLSKRHGTALPGCSLSNFVAFSLVSHVPAPCKITGPLLGLITMDSFAIRNRAGPVIRSITAGFSGTGNSAKGSPYFSLSFSKVLGSLGMKGELPPSSITTGTAGAESSDWHPQSLSNCCKIVRHSPPQMGQQRNCWRMSRGKISRESMIWQMVKLGLEFATGISSVGSSFLYLGNAFSIGDFPSFQACPDKQWEVMMFWFI